MALVRKAGSKTDSLVSQRILALPPSKAQKRQVQIIEAAITVFADVGIEKATYGKIAKLCRVTRPLIQHYFPDKEKLFELVIKYIRGHFQALAVAWVESSDPKKGQLEPYILSTFHWLETYPEHVKVWLLFYYLSGHDEKYRKINTDLVGMGHERIAAIIKHGHAAGVFQSKDCLIDAKLIQATITGALVSLATENFILDKKLFAQKVVTFCLGVAKRETPHSKRHNR